MDVTIEVELDEAQVARLDVLAAETNQPRNQLLKEAIERFVAFQSAQIAHIKEGIAQLDRGEHATEEELDAIEAELDALARRTA
jgi:predicted transcriptional regulator